MFSELPFAALTRKLCAPMKPQRAPRRTSSALLLNALVMPGSGHILAGMAAKGYAIASLTTLFVILPLVRYTLTVMDAMRRFSSHDGKEMIGGLSALGTAWQRDKRFILICACAVALLWLYGIVDLMLWERRKRP